MSEFTDIELPQPAPHAPSVLALGGELKATICFLDGPRARLSHALGDLKEPEDYRRFVAAVEELIAQARQFPDLIAHDMHPQYLSTHHARELASRHDRPLIPVQHHHAHVVACAAENALTAPFIGLACDGTGYGTDRTVWGGEVLLADFRSFRRVGRLRPFRLIGGDRPAREIWRSAASIVHQLVRAGDGGSSKGVAQDDLAFVFGRFWQILTDQIFPLLDRGRGGIMNSSAGRLFDAVAFLLGLAEENETEAQAPVALEKAADPAVQDSLPFELREMGEIVEIDWRPAIRELLRRRRAGEAVERLSASFHNGLADVLAVAAGRLAEEARVSQVCLSGGVFLNRMLTARLRTRLQESGLRPYAHRRLSSGDACLSLGQALIAREKGKD